MYRDAVVKGMFYPGDSGEIKRFIERCKIDTARQEAKMVIVPHAGYVFSGATAVKTLSEISLPANVILMGPNHTGMGKNIAVYPSGRWETPLGDVEINDEIATKLVEQGFEADVSAHAREHSLEVQMPLLKYFRNDVKVVPITFKMISYETCKYAANVIYEVIKGRKDILLIVSSDFNHFENLYVTNDKDSAAISKIMEMDDEGLLSVVVSKDISMCGVIPAVVGIQVVKKLGYSGVRLVEHTTSAEASGDTSKVVGYAGIIVR